MPGVNKYLELIYELLVEIKNLCEDIKTNTTP